VGLVFHPLFLGLLLLTLVAGAALAITTIPAQPFPAQGAQVVAAGLRPHLTEQAKMVCLILVEGEGLLVFLLALALAVAVDLALS
jgi:hypothetical protein